METDPSQYRVVHPLPAAPMFVGREAELQELRSHWQNGFHGVLALVGLGGAGKTALTAQFLDDLTFATGAARPQKLFLWSFYQVPDAGLFLEQAFRYFAGGSSAAQPAKGAALIHLLAEALGEGGPHWLVLDGLERVQCQESSGTEVFGRIEDPLLKMLLARIAEGIGKTVALITSRFPLTDLQAFSSRGCRHLEIGGLSRAAALNLLRQRGVKGDDSDLDILIEKYGAHALTLDHLGGLVGQFLEGNPQRAPEVIELSDPGTDRQALRLARLLRAYEHHLPPTELALLCRLCLLRRSVTEDHIVQFFLCSPPVHARTVRAVVDFFQRFTGLGQPNEDLIQDLAEPIRQTLEEALCNKPIAGPEEVFRSEISLVANELLQLHKNPLLEMDFSELARLYGSTTLETPTDLLPLDGPNRKALHLCYERWVNLREHSKSKVPPLQKAFMDLFGKAALSAHVELTPADLRETLNRVTQILRSLAGKHFALNRVRQLCRIYQDKRSLAGPLAALELSGLRQVLAALVGRHLVLREADGSFSVHPAVRDHFHHLAIAADHGAGHDILREQLVSLVQRPGKRQPDDAPTLDLAEEAIYHALAAGRADEALGLYNQVLGGLRHLGWKLGEMARGLRILRCFEPCPERWDLAWYLRALGEFDQAFACNEQPYFRADILLLQGRLPQVAAMGDSTRTSVADFLMGKTTKLSPDALGSTIPREQLLLYLGRLDGVARSATLGQIFGEIGWQGHRSRCQLLLAEAARRQGDQTRCAQHLDAASVWILHSGSVEHLCLLHLVRSRFARADWQHAVAQAELAEGLHLAQQCGLGLYHIELLCVQAEIFLTDGNATAAEPLAREALARASAQACQFLWGAAQAGHLLGQSLSAQARSREALAILQKILALRERIGDPGRQATERLLASLPN